MPSWANHFRVADALWEKLNIDKEYFAVGTVAPDCGIQTAPHGIYDPPTGATHFTSDYEYSKKTDCDYEYIYKEFVKDEKDLKKYSFYLAYYIHLFVDCYFAKNVFLPIEARYGDFRENEELSQRVKLERGNIDRLYLSTHESPSLELFKSIKSFDEAYPEWYKSGQITRQMENIKRAYENVKPEDMEYIYLTPEVMEKFHAEVLEALKKELKSKGIKKGKV